jgi:hypothetical protein
VRPLGAAACAVVLLVLGGCRDAAGPPPVDQPGTSVQQRVDDLESTLDAIESELDDG